jgi:hypothetical protein
VAHVGASALGRQVETLQEILIVQLDGAFDSFLHVKIRVGSEAGRLGCVTFRHEAREVVPRRACFSFSDALFLEAS